MDIAGQEDKVYKHQGFFIRICKRPPDIQHEKLVRLAAGFPYRKAPVLVRESGEAKQNHRLHIGSAYCGKGVRGISDFDLHDAQRRPFRSGLCVIHRSGLAVFQLAAGNSQFIQRAADIGSADMRSARFSRAGKPYKPRQGNSGPRRSSRNFI